MKYWMDTEFIERPYTIDLISIGLVAEDGREFYAESSEVDWTKASHWTLETVRPQLAGTGMPREYIGYGIREFIDADKHPVFWGYFPAYDWVAFCWLFGGMNDLPFAFPQLCLDIKQWAIELGDPELPHQEGRAPPRPCRRAMDEGGVDVPRRPQPSRGRAPLRRPQESRSADGGIGVIAAGGGERTISDKTPYLGLQDFRTSSARVISGSIPFSISAFRLSISMSAGTPLPS